MKTEDFFYTLLIFRLQSPVNRLIFRWLYQGMLGKQYLMPKVCVGTVQLWSWPHAVCSGSAEAMASVSRQLLAHHCNRQGRSFISGHTSPRPSSLGTNSPVPTPVTCALLSVDHTCMHHGGVERRVAVTVPACPMLLALCSPRGL